MATMPRKSGIDVVGAMPWGTHFCHFYETKADLLDTLVPYFKAGLDSGEFCVWIVSEPLTEADAWAALGRAVPELDRHFADCSIEVLPATEWYLRGGALALPRVTEGWNDKLARALSRGYPGMRVSGDTAWLQNEDWRVFREYEEQLNGSTPGQRLAVLCTYPIVANATTEMQDVLRTHQFAIARRHGVWGSSRRPRSGGRAEIERLIREPDPGARPE